MDNAVIIRKLESIPKLGAFFRERFNDWKIVLMNAKTWREEKGLFVREIYHEAGGKILAYASVEVPEETFYRFHVELQNLGDRSIGDDFLFHKENVSRSPFDIFQVDTGEWVRRSHFTVENAPAITITEYFTRPGLECLFA